MMVKCPYTKQWRRNGAAFTFLVRVHAPKWLAFPQGKHVNNGLLIMGTMHSYFNPILAVISTVGTAMHKSCNYSLARACLPNHVLKDS